MSAAPTEQYWHRYRVERDALTWPRAADGSDEIPASEIIGSGSYGIVIRGQIAGENAAAKLHPILHPPGAAPRLPADAPYAERLWGWPLEPADEEYLRTQWENEINLLARAQPSRDGATGTSYIAQLLAIVPNAAGRPEIIVTREYHSSLHGALHRWTGDRIDPGPMHAQRHDLAPILMNDVAHALAHLHSLSITHRDLNSGNVLVASRSCEHGLPWRAVVTDMGRAKQLASESDRHTCTPGCGAYMAPETQQQGSDEGRVYDQRIDCFSLGVLILQMLSGKQPSPTKRMLGVAVVPEAKRRRAHIEACSDKELALKKMSWLKKLALRCLADQPQDRPSAEELTKLFLTEPIDELVKPLEDLNIKRTREENRELRRQLDAINEAHGREPPIPPLLLPPPPPEVWSPQDEASLRDLITRVKALRNLAEDPETRPDAEGVARLFVMDPIVSLLSVSWPLVQETQRTSEDSKTLRRQLRAAKEQLGRNVAQALRAQSVPMPLPLPSPPVSPRSPQDEKSWRDLIAKVTDAAQCVIDLLEPEPSSSDLRQLRAKLVDETGLSIPEAAADDDDDDDAGDALDLSLELDASLDCSSGDEDGDETGSNCSSSSSSWGEERSADAVVVAQVRAIQEELSHSPALRELELSAIGTTCIFHAAKHESVDDPIQGGARCIVVFPALMDARSSILRKSQVLPTRNAPAQSRGSKPGSSKVHAKLHAKPFSRVSKGVLSQG